MCAAEQTQDTSGEKAPMPRKQARDFYRVKTTSSGAESLILSWVKPLLLLLSCFSHVWLCATPWTAAYQALPSLGFSRQEDWSGLPFPSPWEASLLSYILLFLLLSSRRFTEALNECFSLLRKQFRKGGSPPCPPYQALGMVAEMLSEISPGHRASWAVVLWLPLLLGNLPLIISGR